MDKHTTPTDENLDPVFDKMFKSFMRQVKKDGIIEEVRQRRYYVKPSEIKRLAKKGHKNVR